MANEITGIVEGLQVKRSALIRVARDRGMSAGALARLPQPLPPPKVAKFPPVVLARREATLQTKWHGKPRLRTSGRFASPDQVKSGLAVRLSAHEESDISQRAKAIVGMVARAFGFDPYQIIEGSRYRRFGPARKVATFIVRTLMGIGWERTARALNITTTGGSAYLFSEGKRLVESDPNIARIHDAALTAIRKRWPEYRS